MLLSILDSDDRLAKHRSRHAVLQRRTTKHEWNLLLQQSCVVEEYIYIFIYSYICRQHMLYTIGVPIYILYIYVCVEREREECVIICI